MNTWASSVPFLVQKSRVSAMPVARWLQSGHLCGTARGGRRGEVRRWRERGTGVTPQAPRRCVAVDRTDEGADGRERPSEAREEAREHARLVSRALEAGGRRSKDNETQKRS